VHFLHSISKFVVPPVPPPALILNLTMVEKAMNRGIGWYLEPLVRAIEPVLKPRQIPATSRSFTQNPQFLLLPNKPQGVQFFL